MKRVVIIGAGFGGLFTASRLKGMDITVISPDKDFLFTPLLHEVATGSLDPLSVTYDIKSVLRHCKILHTRAEKIFLKKRTIVLADSGLLSYDYLVIATGSKTNYFGNKEIEKNTYGLKSLEDALCIRNAVENLITRSNHDGKPVSISVVGGGATGLELASELSQYLDELITLYPKVQWSDVSLNLISSTAALLQMSDSFFQQHALSRMKELGWNVLLSKMVKNISKSDILFADGSRLKSDICIWAAGVKPEHPAVEPPIDTAASRGKLPIRPTLQLIAYDEVFAIGDCAICPDDAAPALAQVAEGQAKICSYNIKRHSQGKSLKNFRFAKKGFLISLGRGHALAEVYGYKFKGAFAWWLWRTIYLSKLPGAANRLSVMLHWTRRLFEKRK